MTETTEMRLKCLYSCFGYWDFGHCGLRLENSTDLFAAEALKTSRISIFEFRVCESFFGGPVPFRAPCRLLKRSNIVQIRALSKKNPRHTPWVFHDPKVIIAWFSAYFNLSSARPDRREKLFDSSFRTSRRFLAPFPVTKRFSRHPFPSDPPCLQ